MSVWGCRASVRVFTSVRADLPVKRRTAGRRGSCGTDQTHPRLLEELQTLSWQRPPLPDRAVKQTPANNYIHLHLKPHCVCTHGYSLHAAMCLQLVDNEIHSLKRSTDLDKCIDILKTRTKLRFLLCFFRWWRTIALFNSSSTTRGSSHIKNIKSRRLQDLQPRENTSSSVPTRVSTPANIATWRTVSLLLATSTSPTARARGQWRHQRSVHWLVIVSVWAIDTHQLAAWEN